MARVVVLPVPLIPTNKIMHGSFVAFLELILVKRSTVPASSKSADMLPIRLSLMNFSIWLLSTDVPVSVFFRSDLMESITSVATSDSISASSSWNKTSSISLPFSSFSLNDLATDENAFRNLSNIISLIA